LSEARRHELLEEYPVLTERPKEFVAQFKFIVLLLPGGTKKITGLSLGEAATKQLATSLSVKDEELIKLLKTSANPKKAKKKNKDADKKEEK